MNKVPISQVADKPPQSSTEPVEFKSPDVPGNRWDDPTYNKFSDAMGIDPIQRRDSGLIEKLDFLYNYTSEVAKSDKYEDIILGLKVIKRNLGFQELGPTLIDKLYSWARLDTRKADIQKEMDALRI